MTKQEIGEKANINYKGKNKEQVIEAAKAAAMPKKISEKSDESLLTPIQQKVLRHVKGAPTDPPRLNITDIIEHQMHSPLKIPKAIIKGPEYSYAWLSIEKMDNGDYEGTKWIPVTRNNHSHVPDNKFSLREGGIIFGGQNILGYCYREVQEAEANLIVQDYNKKTERMIDTKEIVTEGATRVDPGATGKVFEQQVLNPEEEYDFQSP